MASSWNLITLHSSRPGLDAEETVPALINALQDDSAKADAKEAVPALINALEDHNENVRAVAVSSIVAIAKHLQDDRAHSLCD